MSHFVCAQLGERANQTKLMSDKRRRLLRWQHKLYSALTQLDTLLNFLTILKLSAELRATCGSQCSTTLRFVSWAPITLSTSVHQWADHSGKLLFIRKVSIFLSVNRTKVEFRCGFINWDVTHHILPLWWTNICGVKDEDSSRNIRYHSSKDTELGRF